MTAACRPLLKFCALVPLLGQQQRLNTDPPSLKRRLCDVECPHVGHRPVPQGDDQVGDGGAREAAGLEFGDAVVAQDAQPRGRQLGRVGEPHPGEPGVKDNNVDKVPLVKDFLP